jgi:ribosomal protein S21
MKKSNKRRNPIAKQLRHFKQKVVKNKKVYDRKKYENYSRSS